jgi:GNAT superfamily N-acetyltransferase
MKLTMRAFQDEDDYWRIREFLRRVFLLNGRQERSWQAARLDYWRWHVAGNCWESGSIEDVIWLWETADGEIAAVLNPEGKVDAHLQMHPGLRMPKLEDEMLAVAEERLHKPLPDGRRKLLVWADEHDALRQEVLTRRGYIKHDEPGYDRQRLLSEPIPDAPVPPGYTVRSLGGVHELPARSWLSWRAFHPDEPDEDYEGWEWYLNVQQAPMYRRDLDIVAVAPDGELAAFCTLWYDDVTRTGYFEPVGAEPAHHRRGLGKAVMCEAMRRIKRMGATLVTVGGFTPAANALYSSVVSPDCTLSYPWVKGW